MGGYNYDYDYGYNSSGYDVSPITASTSVSSTSITVSNKILSTTSTTAQTTVTSPTTFAESSTSVSETTFTPIIRSSYSFAQSYSDTPIVRADTRIGSVEPVYNLVSVYEQRIGANIDAVDDAWSNRAIPFGNGTNIYKLSRAITGVLDGFDNRLNIAHTNIHVPYATGKSLDRLAKLANIVRKENETDDEFRTRIIVTMRASVIGTTFNEVVRFTGVLLNTNVANVEYDFRPRSFPATAFLVLEDEDLNDTPFTLVEIANLLNNVVAADARVVIKQQGTFLFKSVGESNDPDHGFSDTNVEGGTLRGGISVSNTLDDVPRA